MSKFIVQVTEISQRFVDVEADDKDEAYEVAYGRWNNADPQFILTSNDFVDVNFDVFEGGATDDD